MSTSYVKQSRTLVNMKRGIAPHHALDFWYFDQDSFQEVPHQELTETVYLLEQITHSTV
jgi:hypothetical protein